MQSGPRVDEVKDRILRNSFDDQILSIEIEQIMLSDGSPAIKKRARRRVFQPWELISLIEWEGRRRQLIVQLFFTDVRSFEHAHLSFALGCAQNLKTVMADCQPGTRNLNAGRQQLLRDRMSGGNGGNHGSHSSIR